ncbi:uncharacterized protein LOC133342138 isoform X2 [Lethenteron reissneri]|uniref:uncharacterized protein LOC133342138 isoform X2 n=1 Tax=Lethenteron reissneri TaxID=7753 RepID=UPI002AB61FA0|nr:uncharacterized protein LOC133342138 isoform X2 [Lethenteron reissneri]
MHSSLEFETEPVRKSPMIHGKEQTRASMMQMASMGSHSPSSPLSPLAEVAGAAPPLLAVLEPGGDADLPGGLSLFPSLDSVAGMAASHEHADGDPPNDPPEKTNMTWLDAAQLVLEEAGKPLHIKEIKQRVLEAGLVQSSSKSSLEAVMYRETQKGSRRFKRIENRNGVFALLTQAERQQQLLHCYSATAATSAGRAFALPSHRASSPSAAPARLAQASPAPNPRGAPSPSASASACVTGGAGAVAVSSSSPRVALSPGRGLGGPPPLGGARAPPGGGGGGAGLGAGAAASRRSKARRLARRNAVSERYRIKYQRLRRLVRTTIFENAALCDELARVEGCLAGAKEQRRVLLKRFLQYQALYEGTDPAASASPTGVTVGGLGAAPPSAHSPPTTAGLPPSVATTAAVAPALDDPPAKKPKRVKKERTKERGREDDEKGSKGKASKRRKGGEGPTRRLVQPIPLDQMGRPIFPIALGDLTIYSLGEIVTDRPGFHDESHIYPVGFCSTRTAGSLRHCELTCLYTCQIKDGGFGPQFEIVPEDDPQNPIVASSASACYANLMRATLAARGKSVPAVSSSGPEFFGFSHPSVQHLIQSCPGARKCSSYKWVRFEVCRASPGARSSGSSRPAGGMRTLGVPPPQEREEGEITTPVGASMRLHVSAEDSISSLRSLLATAGHSTALLCMTPSSQPPPPPPSATLPPPPLGSSLRPSPASERSPRRW